MKQDQFVLISKLAFITFITCATWTIFHWTIFYFYFFRIKLPFSRQMCWNLYAWRLKTNSCYPDHGHSCGLWLLTFCIYFDAISHWQWSVIWRNHHSAYGKVANRIIIFLLTYFTSMLCGFLESKRPLQTCTIMYLYTAMVDERKQNLHQETGDGCCCNVHLQSLWWWWWWWSFIERTLLSGWMLSIPVNWVHC